MGPIGKRIVATLAWLAFIVTIHALVPSMPVVARFAWLLCSFFVGWFVSDRWPLNKKD